MNKKAKRISLNKKAFLAAMTTMLVTAGFSGYAIVKKTDCQESLLARQAPRIEKVIDGDTVSIKIDGKSERLRLLSIDAPEADECYGKESSQALKDLLENNTIEVQKDISGTDEYDRLLRYLVILSDDPKDDNILVNQYMVRNGYAFYYSNPPDNRYRDLLVSAQKKAKEEKLGMWGECDYDGSKQEVENRAMREEASRPSDPKCIIKGNISEKGYGKTYLIPGCDNYMSVKIDTKKGEAYFCTEKEARDAGFRKASNCPSS